jgi:nucleotide-binding universal stress UspA family protein
MSYKILTVCLDNSAGSSRRLDFAIALAAKHTAHLTGLHLTYSPVVVYDPFAEIGPLLAEWELSIKKRQDVAKENFRTVVGKSGINFDWHAYRSSDQEKVIAHARASDLTILEQRNPKDVETDLGNSFHEVMVLKLGRPVLFLPYAYDIPKNFDKILIAWDGGREAVRAIADAMPFLKQAKQVMVLTINEKLDGDTDLPDVDIAAYLAKHDVNVIIEKNDKVDIAAADWLLSRATDYEADLMVMGAYGHNRLTELLMGGVTRSIMQKMSLPILMSH